MTDLEPLRFRQPITPKDLELLATPDEQLRQRYSEFSFNRKQFRKRVDADEPWQKIIQAHLYFDHVIALILMEALARPDAIKLRRLSFLQKLSLIDAMGLLPSELIAPISAINSLRNDIAHKLDFDFTEQDRRDLENCTPKHLREYVIEQRGQSEGPITLFELLYAILLQTDVFRQKHHVDRIIARKSYIRLQTVVEKTPGAVYRP